MSGRGSRPAQARSGVEQAGWTRVVRAVLHEQPEIQRPVAAPELRDHLRAGTTSRSGPRRCSGSSSATRSRSRPASFSSRSSPTRPRARSSSAVQRHRVLVRADRVVRQHQPTVAAAADVGLDEVGAGRDRRLEGGERSCRAGPRSRRGARRSAAGGGSRPPARAAPRSVPAHRRRRHRAVRGRSGGRRRRRMSPIHGRERAHLRAMSGAPGASGSSSARSAIACSRIAAAAAPW